MLVAASHLEQEVIKIECVTSPMINLYEHHIILISCSRWMHSNRLYTSVCSKFICTLSTIFVFMVTHTHNMCMYMYICMYVCMYVCMYIVNILCGILSPRGYASLKQENICE